MSTTDLLIELERKFDNLLIPDLYKLIYEKYSDDENKLINIINLDIDVRSAIDKLIYDGINKSRSELISIIDEILISKEIK